MNNEPEIDEQVGGPPSTRSKRRHENPSLFNTKFRELEGYEFWITPYNRIFLVDSAGTLTHPRLFRSRRSRAGGASTVLDPPWEGVPETVLDVLYTLLEKQDEVRSKMVADGEFDEDQWEGWETRESR